MAHLCGPALVVVGKQARLGTLDHPVTPASAAYPATLDSPESVVTAASVVSLDTPDSLESAATPDTPASRVTADTRASLVSRDTAAPKPINGAVFRIAPHIHFQGAPLWRSQAYSALASSPSFP